MNYRSIIITTAVWCLAAGAALGQGTEGKGTKSDHIGAHAAGLTAQQFANEAGSAGLTEVELSRIALEKSGNSEIKQFAQMMVKDHTQTNSELAALAISRHIDVPRTLKPEQQAAIDKLRQESGDAFDRAYVAQMVEDHRKAVDLFQKATETDALEADIRQFAEKKLSTLQHHQQQAIELRSQIREEAADAPMR